MLFIFYVDKVAKSYYYIFKDKSSKKLLMQKHKTQSKCATHKRTSNTVTKTLKQGRRKQYETQKI